MVVDSAGHHSPIVSHIDRIHWQLRISPFDVPVHIGGFRAAYSGHLRILS